MLKCNWHLNVVSWSVENKTKADKNFRTKLKLSKLQITIGAGYAFRLFAELRKTWNSFWNINRIYIILNKVLLIY